MHAHFAMRKFTGSILKISVGHLFGGRVPEIIPPQVTASHCPPCLPGKGWGGLEAGQYGDFGGLAGWLTD